MVHPIIDQYYSHNPYNSRSSKFVVEKGLVTNEKGGTPKDENPTAIQTSNLASDLRQHLTLSPAKENGAGSITPDEEENVNIGRVPMMSKLSRNSSSYREDSRTDSPPLHMVSARDPAQPQELGNTKKKRRSLPESVATARVAEERTRSSIGRTGDPAKIARYFPELNLS